MNINNILAYSINLEIILIYFECICKVFEKYRVRFKLDKYGFLKDIVEFVGHDILSNGLCLAKSQFDFINDWKLTSTGQVLYSFIGFINFYHKFSPYFKIRLKPLQKLYRDFF